jgi:hypothetical protein
MNFAQ